MPRPWPEPNLSNSVDIISYANTVTNDWMTTLFMMACVVILFSLLKVRGHRTSDSMLVACLITFMLGSMLWAIALLAGRILVIFLLLTIASALYSVFDA